MLLVLQNLALFLGEGNLSLNGNLKGITWGRGGFGLVLSFLCEQPLGYCDNAELKWALAILLYSRTF